MEQSAVPKASFCLVEAWDLVVNHHCLQEIYHLSLKIGLNTTKRKRPRLPIFHFSGALKCWFPAGVVVIQVRQSYTLKPWKFWSFVREAYGLLLGAVGGKQQFLGLFPHLRIPFHTGYPMLAHHKHNKYNKPSEVLPHNIWMPNVILVWSSKPIFLDKLYKYLINVYRYIYIHLYTYILEILWSTNFQWPYVIVSKAMASLASVSTLVGVVHLGTIVASRSFYWQLPTTWMSPVGC